MQCWTMYWNAWVKYQLIINSKQNQYMVSINYIVSLIHAHSNTCICMCVYISLATLEYAWPQSPQILHWHESCFFALLSTDNTHQQTVLDIWRAWQRTTFTLYMVKYLPILVGLAPKDDFGLSINADILWCGFMTMVYIRPLTSLYIARPIHCSKNHAQVS